MKNISPVLPLMIGAGNMNFHVQIDKNTYIERLGRKLTALEERNVIDKIYDYCDAATQRSYMLHPIAFWRGRDKSSNALAHSEFYLQAIDENRQAIYSRIRALCDWDVKDEIYLDAQSLLWLNDDTTAYSVYQVSGNLLDFVESELRKLTDDPKYLPEWCKTTLYSEYIRRRG
jgi:hypothetical protein